MKSNCGNAELVQIIRNQIHLHPQQMITFHDFMALSLYHATYGYYMQDRDKIGKSGDFYTSSSLHTFMGEMLATYMCQQIAERYSDSPSIDIVEWGGGTGKLCLHILDAIAQNHPMVYKRIQVKLVETSPYHRELQATRLADHLQIITWLNDSSEERAVSDHPQFVIANELLDAFAVHNIRNSASGFEECYVTWDTDQQSFVELWSEVSDPAIERYIHREPWKVQRGHHIEVNLAADEWIARVSSHLTTGQLLIIDYGELTERLWTSHRPQGTLRSYRKHLVHADLYSHIGQQDITAHVNFSACIHTAIEQGLTVHKFCNQAQFLLDQGILEKLQDHTNTDPFSEVAKRNRAIRQLLWGDELSELFKVLILIKE